MTDIVVTYITGQAYTIVSSPRGHTTLTLDIGQRWQAEAFARILNAEFVELP